jgi:hypothetical protein
VVYIDPLTSLIEVPARTTFSDRSGLHLHKRNIALDGDPKPHVGSSVNLYAVEHKELSPNFGC